MPNCRINQVEEACTSIVNDDLLLIVKSDTTPEFKTRSVKVCDLSIILLINSLVILSKFSFLILLNSFIKFKIKLGEGRFKPPNLTSK